MDDAVPVTPVPLPPAAPAPQSPTLAQSAATAIAGILAMLPPDQLATLSGFLGNTIGTALRPIVAEEIDRALKAWRNSAEVAKPNEDLQNDFNAGVAASD